MYLPLKSGAHVPSLGEAGQGEPDAGSDVGGGEDVDGELQGPHVGHGNVQRTLQVVEEGYQLWQKRGNQVNYCYELPHIRVNFAMNPPHIR